MSIHDLERRLKTISRFSEPTLAPPLPEARDLGLLLSDVAHHTIRIQSGGVPDRPRVVAHYQGDGRVVACVTDLSLALALAAATLKLPRTVADEMCHQRTLEAPLDESAAHLFDAVGGMLNWPGYAEVSLEGVYGPGSILPEEARVPFHAPRDRVGYTVGVHGYAGGCLRLLTAWDTELPGEPGRQKPE